MNQDDVKASLNIVVGMLQLNSFLVYALIDPGAHSFVANKMVGRLGKTLSKAKKKKKIVTISTFLGETLKIDHVYKGVRVNVKG
jgi:hypothetical protein